MGHKINPKAFRLGTIYTWTSRWFSEDKKYKFFVVEDDIIRKTITNKIKPAGIDRIEIERSINKINIILYVVRPGMVIGRGGQGLEELKKYLLKTILIFRKKQNNLDKKSNFKLDLRVEPVKEPYLSANFVATQIAEQLERRLPHKRVIGFAMDKVISAHAKGVKVMVSGRIAGAEIARRESYKIGSIPLSTIREKVDFASVPALTKSGYIGVKIWICK
ncbi:30S ribosomal protein S3 [Candidatus Gottesmanbacteria bacterium RBG_13_37_7]|uniref:Small ribosomal subunit protein uS3 n=1 Tax=Candidatus Gottesmanbacteria bacterium RBG_13_37_7 TaxID=1798369 RepID=A0A1F5YJT0_9BACT|nr:MAG: 30S ribosomal protein S3 [Candidatus Gottesmanbacteria bacterium RBG_13_37_7]